MAQAKADTNFLSPETEKERGRENKNICMVSIHQLQYHKVEKNG